MFYSVPRPSRLSAWKTFRRPTAVAWRSPAGLQIAVVHASRTIGPGQDRPGRRRRRYRSDAPPENVRGAVRNPGRRAASRFRRRSPAGPARSAVVAAAQ